MLKQCFICGKPGKFETWQYFDIHRFRHYTAGWCSNEHYKKAKKTPLTIGKWHRHKGFNNCAGER